jgi:hypothetical protein
VRHRRRRACLGRALGTGDDYADYTRSFVVIRDERIAAHVDRELETGLLWPDPIVQLNPAFEPGGRSMNSWLRSCSTSGVAGASRVVVREADDVGGGRLLHARG